jgi:hypothetical protein
MTARQFIIFGSLVFISQAGLLAQIENLSIDKEHAISSIEAHIANVASWQRGDFLIRVSVSSPGKLVEFIKQEGELDQVKTIHGPNSMSILSESTRVHRVRFDFENQRLFIANRSKSQQQLYDSLDREIGKPILETDDRVITVNHEKVFGATRMEAAIIRRFEPEQIPAIELAMDRYGVPNLRLLGLSGLASWSGPSYQRRCDLMRNIEELEEVSPIGQDRYKLFFRNRMNPNDSRTGIRSFYDWDSNRHLPLKFTAYSGYRAEDFPDASQPLISGFAKWKSIDASYVPVMAHNSRGKYGRIAGQQFRFQEETTIEIHWFSINQELPDEYFAESLLHDRKTLDELLDTGVLEAAETKPEQN